MDTQSLPKPVKGWHVSKICILTSLGILITVLNVVVIILYIRTERYKQKIADLLLFGQAFTDLYNGIIFVPVKLIQLYEIQFGIESLNVIVALSFYLGSLMNVIIALDRCFSIMRPFQHRKLMTVSIIRCELIAMWAMALILTCLPFSWWYREPILCPGPFLQGYTFFMTTYLTVAVLALLLLTTLTFHKIFERRKKDTNRTLGTVATAAATAIKGRERKTSRLGLDLKTTILFTTMVSFYCLTFIPTIIITYFDIFLVDYSSVEQYIMDINLYIYLLSSIFNAILTIKYKFSLADFPCTCHFGRQNSDQLSQGHTVEMQSLQSIASVSQSIKHNSTPNFKQARVN